MFIKTDKERKCTVRQENTKLIHFILIVLALVVSVSIFSSCGPGRASNQSDAQPTDRQPITQNNNEPESQKNNDQESSQNKVQEEPEPNKAETKLLFSNTFAESEGVIFVDGTNLSVTINIDRETTNYWECEITSGNDVFTLLEDNPPGKVAQYGHRWVFEAVKPGDAVFEFVFYNEDETPKGNGYRFAFNVNDEMRISSESDYTDLTDLEFDPGDQSDPGDQGDIGETDTGQNNDNGDSVNNEVTDLLNEIVRTVYETDSVSFTSSSYPYNFQGKDQTVYTATCGDGRECMLFVTDDGSVYINETTDTPDFKEVILGNMIVIGQPVNDYSSVDYDAFAQEIIDSLLAKPGTVKPTNRNLFIDHRQVRIYEVHDTFDVSAYLAFDDTSDHIYFDEKANGNFCRVRFNLDTDGYYIVSGEPVSVLEGM